MGNFGLYEFQAEFDLWTWRHPLNQRRVLGSFASFEMALQIKQKRAFFSIASFKHGEGHGRIALRWLCALADKHGVLLYSEIQPSGPLDKEALAEWYKRYGFTVTTDSHGDYIISREPKEGK